MSKQQAQLLAHELTIEYIRKNQRILNDSALDNIPKMVEQFADINKRFYESIIHNETLDKLY